MQATLTHFPIERSAISFHLEGKQEDGLPIPQPTTECEYVEVTAIVG